MGLLTRINKERSADYIIYKKDSIYYALNGHTGDIDKSDADAAVVVNAVLDTGCKIVFKEGTFTGAVPITGACNNITIGGQGKGTILFLVASSDCNLITIGGNGWTIRNLKIDGNDANQGAGAWDGIEGVSKDNVTIENVTIDNCKGDGIMVNGTCDNWKIVNCDFTDNVSSHIASYGASDNIAITRCSFYDCETGSMVTCDGGGSHARNWRIENCHFEGNSGYMAVMVVDGYDCSVIDSYFDVPTATGGASSESIRYETCIGGDITANKIMATESSGISIVSSTKNISIVGNHLEGANADLGTAGIGGFGIDLGLLGGAAVTNITITGNTFYNLGTDWSKCALNLGAGAHTDIIFADNTLLEQGGAGFFNFGIIAQNGFTGSRISITGNNVTGITDAVVHFITGGDDSIIANNLFNTAGTGIHLDDGDDIVISDNQITAATPIDVNVATVVRPMIMGNNWEGSTNDPSYAAATTPRFNYNIDKNGVWWSHNDGQPTTRNIILTASGGWPSTTNGCATPTKVEYGGNDVDMYHLDFDGTAIEHVQWTAVLPDDYDGGTITATFYWTGVAGAGGVRWGLQGRAYADDAIDQAWGTAKEVTDTFIAASDVHITAVTSAITLAGSPAVGQIVQFRVYRDPTHGDDTKSEDARLIAVKISYVGR